MMFFKRTDHYEMIYCIKVKRAYIWVPVDQYWAESSYEVEEINSLDYFKKVDVKWLKLNGFFNKKMFLN